MKRPSIVEALALTALIIFCLYGCPNLHAADAAYDVRGLRFWYPAGEWYAQPGYGLQATVLNRISGEARLDAFSGYMTEPGLDKTVDAMMALGKYARGFVFISRSKFYNGAADRGSENTSAARPNGIRTEYIAQPCCGGRPVAIIQYWFSVDEHTFVVITGSCPAVARDAYGPVFDRIAATAVLR